jgi:hypothetical protein
MYRFPGAIALAFLCALAPAAADDFDPYAVSESEAEQLTLNCGEVKNNNVSWPFGNNLWIEYVVETTRPINGNCPWISVSVEAHVVSVPNSGLADHDMFTASVRRQVPVPGNGTWQTNGHHYRHWLWFFTFSNGTTSSHAEVNVREEDSSGDGEPGMTRPCEPDVPCEAPTGSGGESGSPILLDLARDGYHLTDVADGVRFDLDADGLPELVAWTLAGSDDAFLALDRNGNGIIDDGSELFGNYTPALAAGPRFTTPNGFEALRFTEGPSYGGGERSERINGRDRVFGRLLLWTDRNHNGVSEPDELESLAAAGVQEIDTYYKTASRRDAHGNEFRQRAKATFADGVEMFVYDVWLKIVR